MGLMALRLVAVLVSIVATGMPARGQVLEFESGGLKYKALSHNGVTVMFAPLPMRVHDFSVIQVSVSNGSPIAWTIKPEDFQVDYDGLSAQGWSAEAVIHLLIKSGSHSDVKKLMSTYEAALYGMPNVHSTNGFESRRQNALADGGSTKIKAAAAASAIVLVTTKLAPGQSTDGAVFYKVNAKAVDTRLAGTGKLVVHLAAEVFEFPFDEAKVNQNSK